VPRLTHPLHVQVFWFEVVAGVRFKYPLALALVLSERVRL
jgi:hypothetical protein